MPTIENFKCMIGGASYAKIVQWSGEAPYFIGTFLGPMIGVYHGDNAIAVFDERF